MESAKTVILCNIKSGKTHTHKFEAEKKTLFHLSVQRLKTCACACLLFGGISTGYRS